MVGSETFYPGSAELLAAVSVSSYHSISQDIRLFYLTAGERRMTDHSTQTNKVESDRPDVFEKIITRGTNRKLPALQVK